MGYKRIKKIFFFFMLQMMVIGLSGCGVFDREETVNAFKEHTVVGEWVREPICQLYFHGDTVYFTTYAEIGSDDVEHYCSNRLYCVNRNGNEVEEIPIDLSREDPLTMITSVMLDDDSISIWLSTYDPDESEPVNIFIKTDYNGKEQMRADLNASVNGENIWKALQTAQGQIIAMAEDAVYVFDDALKLIQQIDIEGRAIGMAVSKEGQLICASEDSNGKQRLHMIDLENGKITDTAALKKQEAMEDNSLFSSGQYDICYRTEKGIYSYDLSKKKANCLLDYEKSYLMGGDITDAISAGIDGLVVLNQPEDAIGCDIVLYSRQNEDAGNEKAALTFGAFQFDDNVKRAVLAFNKSNDRYQITLKEYFDEDSGERAADAIQKLNEDIAKGTVPDLLDLSFLADSYAAKGLFEDLSAYIEKDDTLSEDQFIAPVLQAMKQSGRLYTITTDFGIAVLIAKKEYAEQCDGLTLEKLTAFCKEHEDQLPFYAETKSDLFSILLEGCMGDYYDWESGTCRFDSQEFKDILLFCDQIMSEKHSLDTYGTRNESIQQGNILFIDDTDFVPQDILTYQDLLGGEVSYIGYPNKEGQGSYFTFNSRIGIYSGSKMKDGAWEFLRMLLSPEYQAKYADIYSGLEKIPVRKDCFDQLLTNLSTLPEDTEEPEEGGVITAEQVQSFRDMVNRTHKAISYDIEIINIIDEEAQTYFAGKKDVNETVSMIQKRCTTYMNERK